MYSEHEGESVLSYDWAFVVFVSLVFEQQGGLTLIKWSFLDVYLNATPLHHELAHLWNFDSLVHSISISYFVYNMIFLQVSPTDDSILSARLVDNVTVAGCSLCTHSLPQSSLHNEGRKLEIFRFSWNGRIATDCALELQLPMIAPWIAIDYVSATSETLIFFLHFTILNMHSKCLIKIIIIILIQYCLLPAVKFWILH